GKDFQAGVTTRRIRHCPRPVGSQMTLKGFPLGMAALTSLLIRAVVIILSAQVSNHTPCKSPGKVFPPPSPRAVWPDNEAPVPSHPPTQRTCLPDLLHFEDAPPIRRSTRACQDRESRTQPEDKYSPAAL